MTLYYSYSVTVLNPKALLQRSRLWAMITLKNSPRELWQYGAAAFNMCGIAYQRSIMYQTADRTSVWRTMPMQLKTFRAYYPSLTLQPLLPGPTKMIHPGLTQWHTTFFNNHVLLFFSFLLLHFLFFSFLFFCPGQTSPAGRDFLHADGALLLLPPPAAERRKKRWLIIAITWYV